MRGRGVPAAVKVRGKRRSDVINRRGMTSQWVTSRRWRCSARGRGCSGCEKLRSGNLRPRRSEDVTRGQWVLNAIRRFPPPLPGAVHRFLPPFPSAISERSLHRALYLPLKRRHLLLLPFNVYYMRLFMPKYFYSTELIIIIILGSAIWSRTMISRVMMRAW